MSIDHQILALSYDAVAVDIGHTETKLGYGNGENGKGKTATGLIDSFRGLSVLVHDIPTISRAQDIPVMVEGFAEDCMSDLLTNILHEPLNDFTAEQMRKYGCAPQTERAIWTFDAENKTWIQVIKPCIPILTQKNLRLKKTASKSS